MKVLHIHHGDNPQWGGGIIAMHRLHEGLKTAGVESKILCAVKALPSPDSVEIPRRRLVEATLRRIAEPLGLNDLHGISAFNVRRHPEFRSADVVHLQGLHGGFFNYLALPELTRAKPVVYTLHDMWSFTGHCAASYECERWRIGCGRCPHLDAPPAVRRDATRLEWALKQRAYARSEFTVIAVSGWLADLARQSLLGRFPVHHIPNTVDTDVYQPLDRDRCRAVLGIPADRRVIMWASSKLDPNHPEGYRKGADLLVQALATLPARLRAEIVLLLVGGRGAALAQATGLPTVDLGFVLNDRLKAIAYSAGDCFVHPTRAEAFGLVVLEAMACGTPVVAFAVGGVPELVRPDATGHLAPPGDVHALARGITEILEDRQHRDALGRRCREVAVQEYALPLHVTRYVEMYRRVLKDRN